MERDDVKTQCSCDNKNFSLNLGILRIGVKIQTMFPKIFPYGETYMSTPQVK